jgi:hypothetical protein
MSERIDSAVQFTSETHLAAGDTPALVAEKSSTQFNKTAQNFE